MGDEDAGGRNGLRVHERRGKPYGTDKPRLPMPPKPERNCGDCDGYLVSGGVFWAVSLAGTRDLDVFAPLQHHGADAAFTPPAAIAGFEAGVSACRWPSRPCPSPAWNRRAG